MEDVQSILARHRRRRSQEDSTQADHMAERPRPSYCEIPEVFFDEVLIQFRLSRLEINVLMHLYREVWCRPNLYREYGIGQIISLTELSQRLKISSQELYQAIRKLEDLDFIETIRAGQYFVRRYFTKQLDKKFGQSYGDFDL